VEIAVLNHGCHSSQLGIPFGNGEFPFRDLPGLVNVYITNWKITMLLMGKPTISMAMASIAFCMFTRGQRVYPINIALNHYKIPLTHYKIPLNHYKSHQITLKSHSNPMKNHHLDHCNPQALRVIVGSDDPMPGSSARIQHDEF